MKPIYLVYRFASAWREAVKKMFKRLLGAVALVAVALLLIAPWARAHNVATHTILPVCQAEH